MITIVIATKGRRQRVLSLIERFKSLCKIIVVFDGPPFLEEDLTHPNVSIVKLPKNKGQAFATNFAVELVDTDYFMLLDSDDDLILNDQSILDMTCFDHDVYVTETITFLTRDDVRFRRFTEKDDFQLNRVGGQSGTIIRKTVFQSVGGLDETLTSCKDWDLWIRLKGINASWSSYDCALVYNDKNEGISRDLSRAINGRFELILKHRRFLTARKIPHQIWLLFRYCVKNCKSELLLNQGAKIFLFSLVHYFTRLIYLFTRT
jgi:glycosyltransferase involved in cell wall biosynthesis